MKNQKAPSIIDNAILILLTIQIASVSVSIAVSSIAFGIWIGLWLIQLIANRKITFSTATVPELKAVTLFVVLYACFEIVSRFFAIYPEGAFNNLKRLLLFLIFYVSVIKIPSVEILTKIIFANLIAVSVVSVFELANYLMRFNELISRMPFSEIRIDYFSYPLTSAEIKLMTLFSVFPLLFLKETLIVSKKFLIAAVVPVFVSMFLTQSRNVFLACAICFMIYGIAINRKFLFVFIIAVILSWIFLPQEILGRFQSIIDLKHPSNESRLNMWKTGWEMFADHPFTGVADSHIKEIYETYRTPLTQGEGVHLHNNFIMILATTGIFGFLSFIGLFLSLFLSQIKFFLREVNPVNKMLIFGSILVVIAFNIAGIFEWTFGDHEVVTVFFFLVAIPFVIGGHSIVTSGSQLPQ